MQHRPAAHTQTENRLITAHLSLKAPKHLTQDSESARPARTAAPQEDRLVPVKAEWVTQFIFYNFKIS